MHCCIIAVQGRRRRSGGAALEPQPPRPRSSARDTRDLGTVEKNSPLSLYGGFIFSSKVIKPSQCHGYIPLLDTRACVVAVSKISKLVSHLRPCGDGAPQTAHDIWEIWAAGASHAGDSASPEHSAAAFQRGYWGPLIHNMGLCSRPVEDHKTWNHFGPIRAIEPQHRPPGQ